MYKNKLVPSGKRRTETNPYGSYIELTASKKQYNGEYIALSNDTLYVMLLTELVKVSASEIDSVEIVLTRNKAKGYLTTTIIGMIPALIGAAAHPDYGSDFLILALTTGVLGGLAALIESTRKITIISYPSDIKDMKLTTKYARYPTGLPEDLDIRTLIISK